MDYYGTVNLVEACRKRGVKRFIIVSSILVNGAAMGQLLNPAYIFLNIFGLVLVAKLQAENYIRKSGINYTIVRPGGLKNDPPSGNIIMEPEVTLPFTAPFSYVLCLYFYAIDQVLMCLYIDRILFLEEVYQGIKLPKLLLKH